VGVNEFTNGLAPALQSNRELMRGQVCLEVVLALGADSAGRNAAEDLPHRKGPYATGRFGEWRQVGAAEQIHGPCRDRAVDDVLTQLQETLFAFGVLEHYA